MTLALLPHLPTAHDVDALTPAYIEAVESALDAARVEFRAAFEAVRAQTLEADYPAFGKLALYNEASNRVATARKHVADLTAHLEAAEYLTADPAGTRRWAGVCTRWDRIKGSAA